MRIEFQRGSNQHGPWWSTSVTDITTIPSGLIDLEMHRLQIKDGCGYSEIAKPHEIELAKGDRWL